MFLRDGKQRRSKAWRFAGKALVLAALAGVLPSCNKTGTHAPLVNLTVPANNAMGVPLWTPIFIFFDRALDPSTVVPANFSLQDAVLGTTIAINPIWDPDFNDVILVPQSAMAETTMYNVGILAGVEAADGTSFGGNSFSFTTESTALTGTPTFNGATGATAVGGSPGVLQINWTAATDADNQAVTYNVYGATTSGGQNFLITPSATVTQGAPPAAGINGIQVSGLMSGQTYFFIVEAVEGGSNNSFFNTAQVSGVPN